MRWSVVVGDTRSIWWLYAVFFLMIRRPPRSTQSRSSAASDVYKRQVIICAAVINLLMALLFWIVARIPGDPNVGPQLEFAKVLSPVWRIVTASIIAEVIAELLDTEIYRIWVNKVIKRHHGARVLVSNSLSIPIDSLIFVWVAFGGIYNPSVV